MLGNMSGFLLWPREHHQFTFSLPRTIKQNPAEKSMTKHRLFISDQMTSDLSIKFPFMACKERPYYNHDTISQACRQNNKVECCSVTFTLILASVQRCWGGMREKTLSTDGMLLTLPPPRLLWSLSN